MGETFHNEENEDKGQEAEDRLYNLQSALQSVEKSTKVDLDKPYIHPLNENHPTEAQALQERVDKMKEYIDYLPAHQKLEAQGCLMQAEMYLKDYESKHGVDKDEEVITLEAIEDEEDKTTE